jgi:hypothetical protein
VNIAFAFVVAAFAVLPMEGGPVEERVDALEINHFHDINAHPVFSQLIFWAWSQDCGRYVVRSWRIIKDAHAQTPVRDFARGEYVVTWHDDGVMRCVRSPSFIETWSQDGYTGDPEVQNRELLPRDERNELRKRRPFPATQ